MKASYPISVRRECLRLFSEGEASYGEIQKMYSVNHSTFRSWAKAAGIERGSKLSPEEFEAKVDAWISTARRDDDAPEDADPKLWAETNRKNRARFGPTQKERKRSIAEFAALGDPKDYLSAVEEHFQGALNQLADPNLSPEEQVNLMTLQTLLVSLKKMIEAPPPVSTWADAERVIKLTRLTLGMDRDDTKAKAVDLRAINAPRRMDKKPIDVEIVEPEDKGSMA